MKRFLSIVFLMFCYVISFAEISDTDLRKKIAQMIIVGFDGTEIT